MLDRLDHARGWFRKAESDLFALRQSFETQGPYDTACFHAQQAAEKYLKGLLALNEQPIPHTHNLETLGQLCQAAVPGLDLSGVDLSQLTPYAVELRYDLEFWPDRITAEQALDLCERTRAAVLAQVPLEARP